MTVYTIKRMPTGFHYVERDGVLGSFKASTRARAENHVEKLQRGLVRFEPSASKAQAYEPAYGVGFCRYAGARNTLGE